MDHITPPLKAGDMSAHETTRELVYIWLLHVVGGSTRQIILMLT